MTTRTTKAVFVEHNSNPAHSLANAAEFGEVCYIFDPTRRRSSVWEDGYADDVVVAAAELGFDPGVDVFMVSGSMHAVTKALCALQARHGRIMVAYFESSSRGYRFGGSVGLTRQEAT